MRKSLATIFVILSFTGIGQDCRDLLNRMREIEMRYSDRQFNDDQKCWYLSYKVKVIDWENEVHVSAVKYFKQGDKSRFLSNEANIYSDRQLILSILPEQKVLMINQALPEEKGDAAVNFEATRRNFLDSCEILSCKNTREQEYAIVMKAREKAFFKGLEITQMKFEFNLASGTLISVSTFFEESYKLKEMTIYYEALDENYHKDLPGVADEFFDKKGRLMPGFKNYEIIDNREQPITRNK